MKLIKAIPIIAFIFGLMVGCGSDKKGDGSSPNTPCSGSTCQNGDNPGTPAHDASKATNWDGTLWVTHKGAYDDMLKDFGICEPEYPGQFWSFHLGASECEYWVNSARIQISTQFGSVPTSAQVKILAINHSFNLTRWLPALSGSFDPINNNTGMEFRTSGPGYTFSYNEVIKIVSDKPDFSRNRLRLRFYYGGKEIGYFDMDRL